MGVTINYFRRVETEKSRSGHEAGRSAGNVDKVDDLTIFLPSPRRKSHPTSNLQTESVGINSGVKSEHEERTI